MRNVAFKICREICNININFNNFFQKILDDWLTVNRSITLVDLQLDAQNSYLFTYNRFIKIRLRKNFLTGAQDSHLQTVTIPKAAYIQLRCRLPEDEQSNARNM